MSPTARPHAVAEISSAWPRTSASRPQDEPSRPRRQTLVALALGLASAGLLWACYFPLAQGWLAWVALTPLLLLVRSRARPLTVYAAAFLAGLAFYWPVLQWMRVADDAMYFAWGFLATYCALYFPLALFLIRFLDRRTPLPLVLTVPLVWTALEYLRSELGTGFSWYLLAHSQHDWLRVIQVADLTGAYGVSFLLAGVNALFAEALLAWPAARRFLVAPEAAPRWGRLALPCQASFVGAALVGVLAYGTWRLAQDDFAEGPTLALLQGNLDQRTRNDPNQATDAARHYIHLCDLAAYRRPDLIVWPETSYPPGWTEVAPGVPALSCADEARDMAKRWQSPVLLGLKASIPDADGGRAEYNSALLVGGGKAVARYDKIHLVPLGEYVPLRHTLPIMNKLAPYDYDYSIESGSGYTRFPLEMPRLKEYEWAFGAGCGPLARWPHVLRADNRETRSFTFGVLICYEDTDADVARPYGGGDGRPAADFILNISNDGWFNGTSEHEQHLAIARFRAVECRRSVARAVNMGVSAVIDGNGRVLAPNVVRAEAAPLPEQSRKHVWIIDDRDGRAELPASRWREFKKVPGVLFAAIPIDRRTSLYARWGDWLPWSCAALVLIGFVVGVVRLFRREPRS